MRNLLLSSSNMAAMSSHENDPYGMYPQGYQHNLSDKELLSLFLSSKEKYNFFSALVLRYKFKLLHSILSYLVLVPAVRNKC